MAESCERSIVTDTPPGRCISGRGWKVACKKRSTAGRPGSLSKSFSRKKEIEEEFRSLRSLTKQIKESRDQAEAARKERVRSRLEQKRERERRAEVLQKVRNGNLGMFVGSSFRN